MAMIYCGVLLNEERTAGDEEGCGSCIFNVVTSVTPFVLTIVRLRGLAVDEFSYHQAELAMEVQERSRFTHRGGGWLDDVRKTRNRYPLKL